VAGKKYADSPFTLFVLSMFMVDFVLQNRSRRLTLKFYLGAIPIGIEPRMPKVKKLLAL